MADRVTADIESILRGIPGTINVAALSDEQRREAVRRETAHEEESVLPLRNLGVRMLADRDTCFVVLKDARFRPPKIPTVYLVEQVAAGGAPPDPSHVLTVDGVRWHVVGEEVIPGRDHPAEAVIAVEDSFVIFPDRRGGPSVPCTFILPPIGFPELESQAARLGIRSILSVSPSLAVDGWLRPLFGFTPSNELATILVACSRVENTGAPRLEGRGR
jgi:hypothetical protein